MKHPIRTLLLLLAIAIGSTGCLKHTIQQGNVLSLDKIDQIQVGDTRYSVETLLGTPILRDLMHPNKATYIDEYDNPKTGKHYIRGIVIVYDDALRVVSVRRFGFKSKTEESN